jgi:hypothetical protein
MIEIYGHAIALDSCDTTLKRIAELVLQRYQVAHLDEVRGVLSFKLEVALAHEDDSLRIEFAVALLRSKGKVKLIAGYEAVEVSFKLVEHIAVAEEEVKRSVFGGLVHDGTVWLRAELVCERYDCVVGCFHYCNEYRVI